MTFSLVARCAATGRLGVAIATASLAVGARCPFALARIGAVATQSRTDPTIGPRLLQHLGAGADARAAVEAAVASSSFPEWRQVAAVDAAGGIGSFTGAKAAPICAEARGEGAVAIGNLLRSPALPGAMIDAFQTAGGMLEDRLIEGLFAGLAAGGEVNPLQSAALLVVDGDPFAYTNLRVDCDTAPLEGLRELWQQWRPAADRCRRWAIDPDTA